MPQSQKPSSKATYSLAGTVAWFVVVGTSYVVLLMILAGPHFFGHHIKAGDIAEQDLLAPVKTLVPDEEKSAQQVEAARHSVLPVLKRDSRKSSQILNRLKAESQKIYQLQRESILPLSSPPKFSPQEQVYLLELPMDQFYQFSSAVLAKANSCPLSDAAAQSAFKTLSQFPKSTDYFQKLGLSRSRFQSLQQSGKVQYDRDLLLLAASVESGQTKSFLADIVSSLERLLLNVSLQPFTDKHEWEQQFYEFLPDKIDPAQRKIAAHFIGQKLESNVQIDKPLTDARIKEAVAALKPIMKEIDGGSVIVQKGEVIKPFEAKTLEALGVTEVSDPGLATVIGVALFAAFLLYGVYLYTYEAKLFFSPSAIALMSTVSIITVASALFLGPQFPQFVPLPATTLILTVTYGRRLTGILAALILLFLSVSELLTGPHLVALAAASGMALGASVKRRRDLMVTGILVGIMQMVGYASAVVIAGSPAQINNLGTAVPMEMLGGLISAIAAIGSLPFLENIFGILTPYRIAELAEPDQPLMRQLEENAPGTYQHSLAVANLAEGGARAIGADVNLVHTGAMYHDIGKMVTPRYFIENQLGDKNPHDFIPPEESREKVLAHVTNGLALAQKYGLPKAVQAFIPEHQGTTVIAYFFHKACMRDGRENVDPNLYRYPGPKPQTKESAIVMLADVSEAVTHSLHDPTMEEVESAISNVFKARWDDEQFSESGLSHDELEKVKRGFVRVWRTLHHDRLKYPSTTTGRMAVAPTPLEKDGEQSKSPANASTDSSNASPAAQTAATAEAQGAANEWDCC